MYVQSIYLLREGRQKSLIIICLYIYLKIGVKTDKKQGVDVNYIQMISQYQYLTDSGASIICLFVLVLFGFKINNIIISNL